MVVVLDERKAIAAAAVFRAIYLILPLAVAGGLLLGHEVLRGRELFRQLAAKRRTAPGTTDPPEDSEAGVASRVVVATPDRPQGDGDTGLASMPEPEPDGDALAR